MPGNLHKYVASLRLDRWPRSLAIATGFAAALMLSGKRIGDYPLLHLSILFVAGFLLTWFISTANYIINEITDAPYDAFHPTKMHRPLVKQEISRKKLLAFWSFLVAISVIVSLLFFHPFMLASLLLLLLAGFMYNVPPLRVKDIPYLDSTLESANNPIRLLIGWYILATNFPPLFLLLSWWAFGNFLMIGKRVAEKKFLTAEQFNGYRLSLKKYTLKSLTIFMSANGLAFLIFFTLLAWSLQMKLLLYSLPLIIIYLGMFMRKSVQDRDGAEEPEKLLKNPYFACYTLFLVVIFIIAWIWRS